MYQINRNKRHSATGRNARAQGAGRSKKHQSIQGELTQLLNAQNKQVKEEQAPAYVPQMAIETLPVHQGIIQNLQARNFKHLTEIQEKCLQAVLDGRNIMGIAQTGTGKTAAYLMPLIQQLINQKADSQILVIVPTRELAVQVEDEFKTLARGLGLYSINLIGGTSVGKNISDLKRRQHIVIGTPGRLKDMQNTRALNMSKFNTVVLDEFDRLLDMGFLNDILQLVDSAINKNQTILLSATEDASQKHIINKLLDNPFEVRVSNGHTTSTNVDQTSVRIQPGEDKFVVLKDMLDLDEYEKVLVFIETKHNVEKICKKLNYEGINAKQIHGNISQSKRLQAIHDFKTGRTNVLLATDIAARGLDINNVTHVINYEVPRTMDSYIHRIGRTGRAGKLGKAVTFMN